MTTVSLSGLIYDIDEHVYLVMSSSSASFGTVLCGKVSARLRERLWRRTVMVIGIMDRGRAAVIIHEALG